MATTASIGLQGEEAAALYLQKSGYRVLDRNFSNSAGIRLGELDIIAERHGEIVFVEVKASVAITVGHESLPEWRVTRSKLQKMERAAEIYLKERGLAHRPYRFDVVSVIFPRGGEPEIRHIEHAFL